MNEVRQIQLWDESVIDALVLSEDDTSCVLYAQGRIAVMINGTMYHQVDIDEFQIQWYEQMLMYAYQDRVRDKELEKELREVYDEIANCEEMRKPSILLGSDSDEYQEQLELRWHLNDLYRKRNGLEAQLGICGIEEE